MNTPFNSNRTFNVLFKDKSGEQSSAQIAAFEDTLHWNLTFINFNKEGLIKNKKRLLV